MALEQSIWELCARHSVARDNKHYITCERIQSIIAKRPLVERVTAKKLNYYKPVIMRPELNQVQD